MRYKLLGKSGLRVSELCLGTMTFGEDWGWGASKDESRAVFEAFTAAGGNFLDTANICTTTVLIGASKLSQLDDNLAADTLALTPGDLAALDEATKPRPAPLDWLEMTMDEQTRKALA